jgi:hypothetical protein
MVAPISKAMSSSLGSHRKGALPWYMLQASSTSVGPPILYGRIRPIAGARAQRHVQIHRRTTVESPIVADAMIETGSNGQKPAWHDALYREVSALTAPVVPDHDRDVSARRSATGSRREIAVGYITDALTHFW